MNERLKFRAFIDGSCYSEDGEDKDVSFLVYNVAIYGDVTIGASKKDLKEAIKKLELSVHEERTLWEYFIENYGTLDEEWFVIDCDKIEQSTGLEDRNGKLIYQNDILDFDLSNPRNGGHYRGFVTWESSNQLIGWWISDNKNGAWDLRQIAHPNDWMVWGEVVGNIHENRELLYEN